MDSPTEGRGPGGDLPAYTGGCPSAEILAAYIDGVLDPVEAERVTAHLADCEDCYFVYSETLRFQLESEPEEKEGGDVVPFPQPRPRPKFDPRPWYQIAALLLVGAGTGTYFYLFHTPPTLKTAEVAAPIPAQSKAVFDDNGIWTGPVYRGGEAPEEVDEPAFRTGVQLVNLQVSLRAGKVTEAQNAIAAILGILRAGVLTQDLQDQYTKLTSSLEEGRPVSSTALAEADRLSGEVREVYPDEKTYLDLGQWVEAGRLAAAAGNPVFFQDSDTRSFLRHLLWRDRFGLGEVRLDAETRSNLEEVSGILSKGELAASDYDRLTKELGQILERHYPAHG